MTEGLMIRNWVKSDRVNDISKESTIDVRVRVILFRRSNAIRIWEHDSLVWTTFPMNRGKGVWCWIILGGPQSSVRGVRGPLDDGKPEKQRSISGSLELLISYYNSFRDGICGRHRYSHFTVRSIAHRPQCRFHEQVRTRLLLANTNSETILYFAES